MATFKNSLIQKMNAQRTASRDDELTFRVRYKMRRGEEKFPRVRTGLGGHPVRGRKPAHVRIPPKFSRRAVIKFRIVKNNSYGKAAFDLNLKYIERNGVGCNGEKGILYNQNDDFDRGKFSQEKKNEPHTFRIIISPEDASEIDLTDFTKKLMKQVERDLGRQLNIAASNHYNTDNYHAHVVIRGIDKNGNELRIDPDYISHGMRHRAIEQLNRELGLRTVLDIQKQLDKEINEERVTSLDRHLKNYAKDSVVDLSYSSDDRFGKFNHARLVARLTKLKSLGLAREKGPQQWEMASNWQGQLKEMSKRNTIISTMDKAVGDSTNRYFIVNNDTENLSIKGRLVEKGLSDELYDKYYVIIQNEKGDSFYSSISIEDAHNHREGSIVSLSVKKDSWVKDSDLNIIRVSVANGGIYGRSLHERSIPGDTVKVIIDHKKGLYREVKKEEYLDAHEMRIKKLERFKLVSRNQDGTWTVPGGLIKSLEDRNNTNPVVKTILKSLSDLSVEEQVRYRGRVWIDRFIENADNAGLANHGFGADISRYARLRALFLREELGIFLDENLSQNLDKVERTDLMEKLQVNQTRNPSLESMNKIEKIELPNGNAYAHMQDTLKKEFELVPWKKEHDDLTRKLTHKMGSDMELPKKKLGR